ncbi:hypothetical protein [Ekhidna sp.]|uniref:hypothetical protein n=1 Tax=Ekhidna sp. TaxID=2608089 RepID=UPI003299DF9C
METAIQQSQEAQILTDHYYDQVLQIEKSFSDISQYDSSHDYLNDTWKVEEVAFEETCK